MPAKIIPIPAVNAVIFNGHREILLTKRSEHIREPGKWCLPGGHLDGGEDWVTSLKREVNEELGLVVTEHRLLGIYSDPKLTITPEVLNNGCHGHFLVAVFEVLRFEGVVHPNHEVADWGYFSGEQIPQPIVRSHPVRIQDALQFRGDVFVR